MYKQFVKKLGFDRIRYRLYLIYSNLYRSLLVKIYGMDVGHNVKISRHAIVDRTVNPRGIHIGDNTIIAGNAIVLAHDHVRGIKVDTFIGSKCFLGGGSIIMPGIKLGDCVIVGAGAVVTKDVPDNCIVAGNPAKILRKNIVLSENVQLIDKGVSI